MERILFYGSGSMALKLASIAVSSSFEVAFYDRSYDRAKSAAERVGGAAVGRGELGGSLEDAIVIVATPGREVARALKDLAVLARTRRPRIVSDIATFKSGHVGVYLEFPRSVWAAPIHPLFGPMASRMENYLVALVRVPGREEDVGRMEPVLDKMGLRYFVVDVEAHDRLVARTIGVAYTLGEALTLRAADAGEESRLYPYMGTTYRLLNLLSEIISSDSRDLVEEIVSNEYTRDAVNELIDYVRMVSSGKRVGSVRPPRACREPYRVLYSLIEGPMADMC